MNENRVLLFTCIGLITILATLLLPDVGYLQAVRFKSDGENESAKCGAVARGLKLCTRSSEVEIIPGEPFSLTLWLVNISDHEIKVRANRDWSNFEIEILDSNGKSIPSKIVKRSQEGSLSYEEQKEFVNSIRRDNRSK